MGGGSFSERLAVLLVLAPLVHVAVMRYLAGLSLTKKKRFSFWNYVVSIEKNMELRCVQTQINVTLNKII